ncbi:hypothetical protein A2960_06400 [Candidatus Gottesmanbacteria bacterium RIFCSPLOWO2_01_FULL_39_12b]|uniref:2'-deoxynucleoside 5'-phosphate N-hydrolase 1 n=1 Tax=Candidatus Gottesmanbacteria bacterium RIFCSPLOWO2_01_FULL_39_12b TaxID=1798388 RepID=A0A1F6ASA3_9BACT|nr:MAG: hypothetical protein A2960_06400 [Candidatus Gottesmanbacteria bacterium RIFCSPLOWO2_01_FULL_39_12b]
MTAYFTASVVGKKHYLNNYLRIIDSLKAKKIDVVSDHIINATENQIRMETREERLKFQKQLDKWINSCDFLVAETSFPSISVGYEISLALNRHKPVLILYSAGHPPSLLAHHQDESLICEKYTPDTVKGILDDFINYVQGTDDMRFTFFITSKIASYLDHFSRKNKIPKSVYLRQLIEAEMKKRK